jgi:hypothetical protein
MEIRIMSNETKNSRTAENQSKSLPKMVINVDVVCKTPITASDIVPPSVRSSDGTVSIDEEALKQFDDFCKEVEDEILRDFDIVDFTTSGSSDTSRYYTFFIVDDFGNRIVEFVIVLRLSDHERTRNAERQSMRYNARQLRRFGNENSEIIDLNYVIDGREYGSYNAALDAISQKIGRKVATLKARLPKSPTNSSSKVIAKRVSKCTQKQPYIPIHQRKVRGGPTMRKYIKSATEDELDKIKDGISALEDDFDYLVSGIEKLSRDGNSEEALIASRDLNSAINEITARIADIIAQG